MDPNYFQYLPYRSKTPIHFVHPSPASPPHFFPNQEQPPFSFSTSGSSIKKDRSYADDNYNDINENIYQNLNFNSGQKFKFNTLNKGPHPFPAQLHPQHHYSNQSAAPDNQFKIKIELKKLIKYCFDSLSQYENEMDSSSYGRDPYNSLQCLNKQNFLHRNLMSLNSSIQHCFHLQQQLDAEDQQIYKKDISKLELIFNKLSSTSNFRLHNLKTLTSFLESSSKSLEWMKSEEISLTDYLNNSSEINIIYNKIEEMKRKGAEVVGLMNKAEKYINDKHPAINIIQLNNNLLEGQWERMRQLISCLQIHHSNLDDYIKVEKEVEKMNNWVEKEISTLSTLNSQQIQNLSSLINKNQSNLEILQSRANQIPSPKFKSFSKFPSNTPLKSLCSFNISNVSIEEGENCFLLNDSLGTKWRIRTQRGQEALFPSICFSIFPSSSSLLSLISNLKEKFRLLKNKIEKNKTEEKEKLEEEMKINHVMSQTHHVNNMLEIVEASIIKEKQNQKNNYSSDLTEIKRMNNEIKKIENEVEKLCLEVGNSHFSNESKHQNNIKNLTLRTQLIKKTLQQLLEKIEIEKKLNEFENLIFIKSKNQNLNIDKEIKEFEILLEKLKTLNFQIWGDQLYGNEEKFGKILTRLQTLVLEKLQKAEVTNVSSLVQKTKSNYPEADFLEGGDNLMMKREGILEDYDEDEGPIEDHMYSEDTEEMVQPIKDGEEKITKNTKQDLLTRKHKHGLESISSHQKKFASTTSTKTSACSGKFHFPLFFQKASKFGLIDYEKGLFTHPETNDEILLRDAVMTGLVDCGQSTFLCPTSKKIYPLKESFSIKLLNQNGGFESLEGLMNFKNLIDKKFIVFKKEEKPQTKEEEEEEEEETYYESTQTIETTSTNNVFALISVLDPETHTFIDPFSAVQLGILDQANAIYNARDSGGLVYPLPLRSAIEMNFVQIDPNYKFNENDENHKLIHETQTYSVTGVVDPLTRKKITLSQAVKQGFVDQTKATFYNHVTKRTIPIIEAIVSGFVLADVTSSVEGSNPQSSGKILTQREVAFFIENIIHPVSGKRMTIKEAVREGIFNAEKGEIKNPRTGSVVSLNEAIEKKWVEIKEKTKKNEKEQQREEKVKSLHIDDEMEAKEEMAREEIVEERRVFQITGVKDTQNNRFVSFDEAVYMGLVDEKRGLYINFLTGGSLNINQALEKGFIVGSLQSVAHQELFKSDIVARKKNEIHSVYNPINKTVISVNEAINLGLVSGDLKTYYNPSTNRTLTVEDAIQRGLIKIKDAKSSNQSEETQEEIINSQTRISIEWSKGRVINNASGKEIPIREALKHGLIEKSVAAILEMKNPPPQEKKKEKEEEEEGEEEISKINMVIQMTFVRDKSGKVIIREDNSTKKEEFSEEKRTGSLYQSSNGMSFCDAVKLRLFSIQRGNYYDPHTKRTFSLTDSISIGLLNTKLSALVDLTSDRTLSLKEILDKKIIDSHTGKFSSVKMSELDFTLDPIFLGLQTPSLNLEDAIRCRLFDEESGLFNIPFTDKFINLSTAIDMNYIAGKSNIVLNPKTGERNFLDQAVRLGVIDGTSGRFVDSTLEKNITLSRAILLGLVKNCYLNNCSIIMQEETGDLFPIEEAIEGRMVDYNLPSVYDCLQKKRVSLKIALNSGLIDLKNKIYFNMIKNNKLNLTLATRLGLISFPGSPILAQPEVMDNDVIKTELHANVFLIKKADLKQKTKETYGDVDLPPLELTGFTEKGVKTLSNNPQKEITNTDEESRKMVEQSTYDTKTDETPIKMEITKDGNLFSSQKKETKVQKSKTKESVENVDILMNGPSVKMGPLELPDIPERVDSQSKFNETQMKIIKPLEVIQSLEKPNSFQEFTSSNISPPIKTQYMDELEQRRAGVEIDYNKGMVMDNFSNRILTPGEAFAEGLIDLNVKQQIEKNFNFEPLKKTNNLSLNEALQYKLIIIPLSKIKNPQTKETLTLEEAISCGLIDLKRSLIKDPASGQKRSVFELVQNKIFNIKNAVMTNRNNNKIMTLADLISQNLITNEGLQEAKKPLLRSEALGKGLLSEERGEFREPKTGTILSEELAYDLGYVVNDVISFTIPKSQKIKKNYQPLSLMVALKNGMISHQNLTFIHPDSGEEFPLDEAIDRGLILVPPLECTLGSEVDGVEFEEAFRQGYIDLQNNQFTDPITGTSIPFDSAIKSGFLLLPGIKNNTKHNFDEKKKDFCEDSLYMTKFLELKDLPLSLEEAVTCGLYNENSEFFINPKTKEEIPLFKALQLNIVNPLSFLRVPGNNQKITLAEALEHQIINPISGKFSDPSSRQPLSFSESIDLGYLEDPGSCVWIGIPFIDLLKMTGSVSVFDQSLEKYVPLQQAINSQVVDLDKDLYRDTKNKINYTLKQAAQKRLILIEGDYDDEDQAEKGIVRVLDTARNNWLSTNNALRAGILNLGEKLFYDTKEDNYYSIQKGVAMEKIQLQPQEEKITKEKIYSIKRVYEPSQKTWLPPQSAEERGIIDLETREYLHPSFPRPLTFMEAVQKNLVEVEEVEDLESLKKESLISSDIKEVFDYTTGEKFSIQEAINRKLVDQAGLFYLDPRNGNRLSLYEAWQKGFLRLKSDPIVSFESKRIKSVLDPRTKEEIPIADAIRHQIVDKAGGKFLNLETNSYMDLDYAINKGFVVVEPSEKVFKKEALVEIEEPYRSEPKVFMIKSVRVPSSKEEFDPEEAERRGYINKIQGIYMDPLSGMKIPIKEAIKKKLITASLVEDPDYDNLQKNEAAYAVFESDKLLSEISFVKDFLTGEKISVMEAVRRGIIDFNKKSFLNTQTGEQMKIEKAIKQNFIMASNDKTLPRKKQKLYYFTSPSDPQYSPPLPFSPLLSENFKPAKLTLKQAFSQGLIDQKKNLFLHPATRSWFSINSAIQAGLLEVDQGSGSFQSKISSILRDTEKSMNSPTSNNTFGERSGFQVNGNVQLDSSFPKSDSLERLLDELNISSPPPLHPRTSKVFKY